MYPIEAGLLYRRQIRKFLLINNIKFTEDKGWLESLFMIDCDLETFNKIINIINNSLCLDK